MDARVVATEWALVLPLAAACLLPGAAIAVRAAARLRLDLPGAAALSFAGTVALYSAATTLAWALGWSLDVATAVFAALAAGVWWIARGDVAPAVRRLAREGGWSGLGLGVVAALVAGVQRPWFFTSSDIFYHVAAIRSLVRSGQVFVTDPIYGTATRVLDPTSGVWHSMLAAFVRLVRVEPSTAWLAAMAIGAFVLAVSAWSLMRRVSGSDRVADGMTLLLLAGTYLFDLRASAYPNQVSFALTLLFAALLARAIEEREVRHAVLAALVGYAVASMHVGSAELVVLVGLGVAAWTLVLSRVSRAGDDAVPARAAAYPLAALAAAFLPALPVLVPRLAALSGSSVIGEATLRAISGDVLELPLGLRMLVPGHYLGPTWVFVAGLAACVWALARSRGRGARSAVVAVAVATLPVLLLTNPLSGTLVLAYSAHMARRLAKLLPFAPYVGIAWAVGVALARSRRGRGAFVTGCVAVAGVALTCMMLFGTVPRSWPSSWPGTRGVLAAWPRDLRWWWGERTLDAVRAEFAASGGVPVLAGSPAACYQLTGLADAWALSVVEAHSPYPVEVASGRERRSADAAIDDAATAPGDRYRLARRWNVSYLVFDDDPRESAVRAAALADRAHYAMVSDGRLLVLRVRR